MIIDDNEIIIHDIATIVGEGDAVINDIAAHSAFIITMEWLLALMKRFPQPLQFGLVLIEYGRTNELSETYGALDACKQLSAVTESIKNAFRKTDIVARNATDFWVIAPYTYDEEKIQDKILGIIQEAKHKGLSVVDREISIFTLPLVSTETKKLPVNALEFLAYLKENKNHLANYVFRLSAAN